MTQNYVVTSVDKDKKNGGSKAKSDVGYFLTQNLGFKEYKMSIENRSRIYFRLYMNTTFRHFLKNARPETIVFQYPNASVYVMNKLIRLFRYYCPKGKLYFLIHDIMGVQVIHDQNLLNKELLLFNMTDGLIVHNQHMQDFLIKQGVRVKMVNLELFDYQTKVKMPIASKENSIAFPGNLSKSVFLQKLDIKTPIYLYGTKNNLNYASSIHYVGYFPADSIGIHMKEKYGLVWDGTSVDTCAGNLGEYLKINNPHKASLFISNGMPIITWEGAALADVVRKYKIGIIVRSLTEVDERLANVSQNEYNDMKDNVLYLTKRVRNGYFITKAVKQLLSNEE